jgi:hypothetical protein
MYGMSVNKKMIKGKSARKKKNASPAARLKISPFVKPLKKKKRT